MADPTPAKIPISFLATRALDREVRRLAERDDLSIADVVRSLLKRGLAAEHNDDSNEAA